jgi:hypothetical protein
MRRRRPPARPRQTREPETVPGLQARTLGGTRYVPTAVLGEFAVLGVDRADAFLDRDWPREGEPETCWTTYPA